MYIYISLFSDIKMIRFDYGKPLNTYSALSPFLLKTTHHCSKAGSSVDRRAEAQRGQRCFGPAQVTPWFSGNHKAGNGILPSGKLT